MELKVGRKFDTLQRLTVKQLRAAMYVEVFGEETPGHNKAWLVYQRMGSRRGSSRRWSATARPYFRRWNSMMRRCGHWV